MSKFIQAAQTSQMLSLMALEEASRQGLREADIEHLFLALVLSDQAAGRVLRGLGISIEDARRAVREQHEDQISSLGIRAELPEPGRIVFHETDGYELTRRTADLIGRAAGKNRDGSASSVLHELVVEPSGLIDDILHRLGATRADVLVRLDQPEEVDAAAPSEEASEASKGSVRASGSTQAFVPASVDMVWEYLVNPDHVPAWQGSVGSIERDAQEGIPGAVWHGHAPTVRPDGKPMKIRPPFRRREIELAVAHRAERVAWRFSYPDAPRTNPILTEFMLTHTTGGTQVIITMSWTRHRGWRRVIGLPLRPVQKFLIWISLSQIAAAVSRAFR